MFFVFPVCSPPPVQVPYSVTAAPPAVIPHVLAAADITPPPFFGSSTCSTATSAQDVTHPQSHPHPSPTPCLQNPIAFNSVPNDTSTQTTSHVKHHEFGDKAGNITTHL